MAISLSSGDLKSTRQLSSGQGNNHLVANKEVPGTANHSANCISSRTRYSNLAPANCLAVCLRLFNKFQNFANHNWTLESATVCALFFKANSNQLCHDILRGFVFSQVNKLGQPAKWNLHLDHRTKLLGETDICLNHVAHVSDTVSKHQRALNAHSKSKA